MMTYILKRLTERSTWLGLIALATACSVVVEQELAEQVMAAGMALAGLIGVLTRDRKQEEEEKNGQ